MFIVLFSVPPRYCHSSSHQLAHQLRIPVGIATVQIEQVELPALLPTLDALDAEFGCEDEQCAPGRRKQGGAPMDSTFRPTQSEFPTHPRAARPTVEAMKPSSLDGGHHAAVARQASIAQACPFLDRFLRGCWHNFGLAVIWRCSQSHDS